LKKKILPIQTIPNDQISDAKETFFSASNSGADHFNGNVADFVF